MKLIELPKSPYWGANVHVGFGPDGKKRYSPRSSKVVRDPSRVGPGGVREDKVEAMAILTALQNVANQAMTMESDRVSRQDFEGMVAGVLRAVGKKLAPSAPSWESFSHDVLTRHCHDLSPATVRSYWSKKAGFDEWLTKQGRKSRVTGVSRLSDFRVDDVQEFYDWRLAEGGGVSTANAAVKCLSMIFSRAIVSDHISKNPCAGVSKRFAMAKSKKPFTVADFSRITGALINYADKIEFADEWSLAIRFSIFTGSRQGDCVGLKWSDFSEDFQTVSFVQNKKEVRHNLGKLDGRISLMLPEFVAAMFRAAREASTSQFVTPSLRAINPGKNGLGARFREILDLASVEYEIIPAKGPKGAAQPSHGFHSFRHSLKTELRAAGVSAASSDFLTGHDDAKVGAKYVEEKASTILRECLPVFEQFQEAIENRSESA
jgi:integrase